MSFMYPECDDMQSLRKIATRMLTRLVVSLLVAATAVTAHDTTCVDNVAHPDHVSSLPGWNQPLPSHWFSGFLEYEFHGQTVHTHYVLVQAEDVDCDCGDNPCECDEDKPLIYWSNGGPGASSLFGLLTEVGPLWINDDSLRTEEYRQTGIPSLLYNNKAWTRFGHIVMIDQPAPIGFSYCNDDVGGHGCGDMTWTDELASANSYAALQAFYEVFPCLKPIDLYLIGESYGGIYIPTLARRVLQGNDEAEEKNSTVLPLKGDRKSVV